MSQSPNADEIETKEAGLQHPSGWLYLTQHESIPILVDALLDLTPGLNSTRLNSPTMPASPDRPSATTSISSKKSKSSNQARTPLHSATVLPTVLSSKNCSQLNGALNTVADN